MPGCKFLAVYDTMGYMNVVNEQAAASMQNAINNVKDTDSYKLRNGMVRSSLFLIIRIVLVIYGPYVFILSVKMDYYKNCLF